MSVYQDVAIMNPLCEYLKSKKKEYEQSFVIKRDAFRWLDEDGHVMSNHYEGQSLMYLAETFNYEILINFNHVALVRKLEPEGEL